MMDHIRLLMNDFLFFVAELQVHRTGTGYRVSYAVLFNYYKCTM
jgi:hypothetical protein